MSENQWNKKWKKLDTHRNRDNPPKNSRKDLENWDTQKDQQTNKEDKQYIDRQK